MSIIAAISRRLQTLTTDSKPDPPRIVVENLDPGSDLSSPIIKQKSAPVAPEPDQIAANIPVIQRQKSASDDSTTQSEFPNLGDSSFSGNSKPGPRPKSPRTKTKPKYSSSSKQITYNIVNSNGVKIGSNTHYICTINQCPNNGKATDEGYPQKTKADEPMPLDVKELCSSTAVISLNDMLLIKTHIGYGWRDVARRLDYSEGQIEQFEESYRNNKRVDEVIYKILLDWKQTQTHEAQLGVLVGIIWTCREYDCAKLLAASHKKST